MGISIFESQSSWGLFSIRRRHPCASRYVVLEKLENNSLLSLIAAFKIFGAVPCDVQLLLYVSRNHESLPLTFHFWIWLHCRSSMSIRARPATTSVSAGFARELRRHQFSRDVYWSTFLHSANHIICCSLVFKDFLE